jgi:prepilin-type N-terminal cleavage/methylation domain-containing protein
MMRPRYQHGFTLIEVLVTMLLMMVVFGATLSLLDAFQNDNRLDQLRNETQDNARNAMDRLARQLRNVVAPTKGVVISPGALEEAQPYSLAFETVDTLKTAAAPNKNNVMRVRYCLDVSKLKNEVLWEQVARWGTETAPELPTNTACPDKTAGDWETTTQVVRRLTNKYPAGQSRPLFVYSASGIPQIVSVETNVYIDVSPGHVRPGESQLSSGVSLRNANRPPIVSFTAIPKNGQAELNASASHDPDGLALTYKWWQDGALLPTTAQRYTTTAPGGVHGTHTFKLEVTNPGGLSGEETQSVTFQ